MQGFRDFRFWVEGLGFIGLRVEGLRLRGVWVEGLRLGMLLYWLRSNDCGLSSFGIGLLAQLFTMF